MRHALLALLATISTPIVAGADPIFAKKCVDEVLVHYSGEPAMWLVGHWSVVWDLGPHPLKCDPAEFDPFQVVQEGGHTTALAEAHGAQIRADATSSHQEPVLHEYEESLTISRSISASSTLTTTVTWHPTAPIFEGVVYPPVATAISVALQPKFTAWMEEGVGENGAILSGDLTLRGLYTGAVASANGSWVDAHPGLFTGSDPNGGDFQVQAPATKDWKIAGLTQEEVRGTSHVLVSIGGTVYAADSILKKDVGISDSKAGMCIVGVAVAPGGIEAKVEVYYGWY